MKARLHVSVVSDAAALEALGPAWDALWSRVRGAPVFLSHPWARAWWHHFAPSRRLCVRAVHDAAGTLVGVLPLMRERTRLAGVWPARQLAFLGHGVAAADHMDILAEPAHAEAAATACLADIRAAPRDWDVLALDGLAADGALTRALRLDEIPAAVETERVCAYLPLPETWEAYLASLSSSRRSRIGHRRRRLEKSTDSPVRFEVLGLGGAAEAAALPAAMEDLFRLHQHVQTGRGNPGSFAGTAMRGLHVDFAAEALRRGWLRLHRLTVGGQAIAVVYCFHAKGETSCYSLGHDTAWTRHNVGRQLMAQSFRQAIEDGAAGYDFLRGDEAYKSKLAPEARTDLRVRLPAPRPLPRLALALDRTARRLKRGLKARLTRAQSAEAGPTQGDDAGP